MNLEKGKKNMGANKNVTEVYVGVPYFNVNCFVN